MKRLKIKRFRVIIIALVITTVIGLAGLFGLLKNPEIVNVLAPAQFNIPGTVTKETYAYYCPLNGLGMAEMPNRPVAVTVDNSPAARPQSGLLDADIVYEAPVEGGVTRLLLVYYRGGAEKIGPVRSARPYLIELAQETQSVFVHVGESPQAQTYFKREQIDHINEMFNPRGFWRDKSRKAPHNLYTSSANLAKEMTRRRWDKKVDVQGFSFLPESEILPGGTEAKEINIRYPVGKVKYLFEEDTNTYLRLVSDKPYQDRDTGTQVAVANIVVQLVKTKVLDKEGRLDISLTGEGKAILFSQGHAYLGKWKKPPGTAKTIFTNAQGEEFRFRPGQTWFQIVPDTTTVTY